MIDVRPALPSEHNAIMRVARQTKWTKDFGNQVMFSSAASYAKEWVLVAVKEEEGIVGFACFRIKKRTAATVLYFVGVDEKQRKQGIGWALIEAMMRRVPETHCLLEFKCALDNPVAKKFYDDHKFKVASTDDKYWVMQRQF